jgi:hypothetical protein
MAAEQWPSLASEALKFASVANLKLGLRPKLCSPQPLNNQLAIERKIQLFASCGRWPYRPSALALLGKFFIKRLPVVSCATRPGRCCEQKKTICALSRVKSSVAG